MTDKKFPSIFEEMIKRMRRQMRRGFPFNEESELEDEDFLNPFEDMLDQLEKENTENWEKFVKEESTPDGKIKRFGPFVYGFSYSKKPGEEPEIQEFGNVRPSGRGKIEPSPEGEREPLAEVIDLGDKYEITFEVPGVKKDNISLSASEDSVRIETDGARKYKKSISFDDKVDPEKVDANFKNGILTVEIEKKESEDSRREIEIE